MKTFWLPVSCCAALLLTAAPKDQPHWPIFRKHLIDAGANESAAVADVNQDGRLDIIAGENWFEAPDWKKHRMREIPFFEGFIDDLSNFAMDVNDDGYPDVIASGWFGKKLAWYENPRRHDGDHANDLWKEHIIEIGFNYELFLLADIDGDGKALKVLPNYGSSGEIAWLERSKPFSEAKWIRHHVGAVPGKKGLHGIGAGDVNGDGRTDIITAHGWFEAPPRSAKRQLEVSSGIPAGPSRRLRQSDFRARRQWRRKTRPHLWRRPSLRPLLDGKPGHRQVEGAPDRRQLVAGASRYAGGSRQRRQARHRHGQAVPRR